MNKTASASDTRRVWAFAVDTVNRQRRSRRQSDLPQRYLNRYMITACSPGAKALGITQGMPYSQAKRLAPGMRVIVCNR